MIIVFVLFNFLVIAPPPNYCANSPCKNNATCRNLNNGYSCNCSNIKLNRQFSGKDCEKGKFSCYPKKGVTN